MGLAKRPAVSFSRKGKMYLGQSMRKENRSASLRARALIRSYRKGWSSLDAAPRKGRTGTRHRTVPVAQRQSVPLTSPRAPATERRSARISMGLGKNAVSGMKPMSMATRVMTGPAPRRRMSVT
jgi:hypothetical protein